SQGAGTAGHTRRSAAGVGGDGRAPLRAASARDAGTGPLVPGLARAAATRPAPPRAQGPAVPMGSPAASVELTGPIRRSPSDRCSQKTHQPRPGGRGWASANEPTEHGRNRMTNPASFGSQGLARLWSAYRPTPPRTLHFLSGVGFRSGGRPPFQASGGSARGIP